MVLIANSSKDSCVCDVIDRIQDRYQSLRASSCSRACCSCTYLSLASLRLLVRLVCATDQCTYWQQSYTECPPSNKSCKHL